MKEVATQLTWLEIFFISTTILSLFGNVFQFMIWWRDKTKFHIPIFSALVALFNDIKSKITNVYLVQQVLFNPQNPNKDLDTMKWEFYQFTTHVMSYMQGFQENVVGY